MIMWSELLDSYGESRNFYSDANNSFDGTIEVSDYLCSMILPFATQGVYRKIFSRRKNLKIGGKRVKILVVGRRITRICQ